MLGPLNATLLTLKTCTRGREWKAVPYCIVAFCFSVPPLPCCPSPHSLFKELASIGERRLAALLGSLCSHVEGGSPQVDALKSVRDLTSLILQRKRLGPLPASQKAVSAQGSTQGGDVSASPDKEGAKGPSPKEPSKVNGVGGGVSAAEEEEQQLVKALEAVAQECDSARQQVSSSLAVESSAESESELSAYW